MKLRAQYDNHDKISDATGLKCEDPSLAQQHQKDETDINLIVRRYMNTGELPIHHMPPLQEDFEQAMTMQDAMQLGVEARMAFMEHPAEVRARFNNDPAAFVAFVSDDNNRQDLIKLGLLSQEAVDAHNRAEAAKAAQNAADAAELAEHRKGGKPPKS